MGNLIKRDSNKSCNEMYYTESGALLSKGGAMNPMQSHHYYDRSDNLTHYSCVLILGSTKCGKSSFVHQFLKGTFVEDDASPSIQDTYIKSIDIDVSILLFFVIIFIEGVTCGLDILDPTGSEEFAALQYQWIRQSAGIILGFDLSSDDSFESCTDSIQKIDRINNVFKNASKFVSIF